MLSFALAPARDAKADGAAEIAKFSDLPEIDVAKLADGKPVSHGAALKDFPRGLAVQTCYVVPLPLQKAVEFHKQWDASRHSELKIYLHGDLSAKPAKTDFKNIALAPGNSAVQSLVKATQKLDASKPELQMSVGEAKLFTKGEASSGSITSAVAAFWSDLLLQRATAFAAGGLSKQPPYYASGKAVSDSEEFAHLLASQPKVAAQFKSTLSETALTNPAGKLPASLYYELFDVEGQAAFMLGASYAKPVGESAQLIDCEYYSSGGCYILVTFYQLWPVKIGFKDATLVWRDDLLSSASLSELNGAERLGSAAALKKEIEKGIGCFQKDAAQAR